MSEMANVAALALVVCGSGCTTDVSGMPIFEQSDESGDAATDTTTTTGEPEPDPPAGSSDDAAPMESSDGPDPDGFPDSPDIPEFSMPCEKVDVLFAIDSSGSMSTIQQNLIDNFPVFVTGLENKLADVDSYHIGVVSHDVYLFNEPEECQGAGALITATGGENASGMVCGPYADGARYMTEADELTSAFECTAQVGTDASPAESQVGGVLLAVGDTHAEPGGCNEGFIREDALLVVVIITNEEDGGEFSTIGGTPGDPPDWYEELVEVKGGIESNIVVLSLIGLEESLCAPQAPGVWEESIGLRIAEFTNMFTYGFVGDVCEPSYEGFLEEAVDVVDVACINYIPVG
ncbi:MAG: hypothetical protein AAF721_26745 [Myxococcota bacterium]